MFIERVIFYPEYASSQQMHMSQQLSMLKMDIREFVSTQSYRILAELQSNARKIEIQKGQRMLISLQKQPVEKRFKFADSRSGAVKRRSFGCGKCGRFRDGRCRSFSCRRCAMRDISAGIVGRVCGFVFIAIGRATSKLNIPFSFLVNCRTLHLQHGRCLMDANGGMRCLGWKEEANSLLKRIQVWQQF